MRDLLKEAEVNLINTCVAHRSALNMLDALDSFGRNYINSYGGGSDEYHKGLAMMKRGLHLELSSKMSNLLIFAGVGGIEANKYARQEFENWFSADERKCVSNFLEEHGNYPSAWCDEDEKLLRKQAKDKISKICK